MRHMLFGRVQRLARFLLIGCAILWLAACAGHSSSDPGGIHPAATATTAPNPTTERDAVVSKVISKMTLDQQIGQLLMVEIEGVDYNSGLNYMVTHDALGGLIIYNNDARSEQQMKDLLAQAQAHAILPLEISSDVEGGAVDRLAPFFGPTPSAYAIGQENYPLPAMTDAFQYGQLDAQHLLDLGFNVDLAPVVDVGDWTVALEWQRLWSTSPALTADLAGSFLDGLQSSGVIGTLKHWPGIGSLLGGQDPHLLLPTLPDGSQMQTLQQVDFAPFRALLSHNPAMIMVTHVIVPSIDPGVPATLSAKVLDGTLRQQLGYQGVVITDSLHMKGIDDYLETKGYTLANYPAMLGEAGVESLLAGNDILEGAFDADYTSADWMLNALQQAVQSGRVSQARVELSDKRILDMKWDYNIGRQQMMKFAGLSGSGTSQPTPTSTPVAVGDAAFAPRD
jgi:beta-N-acetylhexosaminidase